MPLAPPTHLVLIPSYNTGSRLASTVADALSVWPDVWVVIDGSTDGSDRSIEPLAARHRGLRLIRRSQNGGKGAAVATGTEAALAAGFTHALVMDADGQHPIDQIVPFLTVSRRNPAALVLGRPVFGPEVPRERLHGRKLSVGLVHLETLGGGIDDPLFGFRVYPLESLRRAFSATRTARGYDFDPEIAVRMFWAGVPTLNLPAACRYLTKAEGGVSHFNYVRDNIKMVRLHTRLLGELLCWRWPAVRRVRERMNRAQTSGPVPSVV
jgi:glycosyltransferase involved in cell wall biosynthesis